MSKQINATNSIRIGRIICINGSSKIIQLLNSHWYLIYISINFHSWVLTLTKSSFSDDLNKTKLNFISLDSVDVFSVQAKQVKVSINLYNC